VSSHDDARFVDLRTRKCPGERSAVFFTDGSPFHGSTRQRSVGGKSIWFLSAWQSLADEATSKGGRANAQFAGAVVTQAEPTVADLKAASRLFANENVTFDAAAEQHRQQMRQTKPGGYLFISDTTDIDRSFHHATTGLGPLGDGGGRGPWNHRWASRIWARPSSRAAPWWSCTRVPEDEDLPSTFRFEYVRAWKKQDERQ
jgi:hypothetical protein